MPSYLTVGPSYMHLKTHYLSILQLMGLSILAIGVWAWTEKDTFNNLSRLTNIALDPAFVLIVTGGLSLPAFPVAGEVTEA